MQVALSYLVLQSSSTYAGTIYSHVRPQPQASTRRRGGQATSAGLRIFLENLHLYAEVPLQGGAFISQSTSMTTLPTAPNNISHLDPFFFSKIQGGLRNFLI